MYDPKIAEMDSKHNPNTTKYCVNIVQCNKLQMHTINAMYKNVQNDPNMNPNTNEIMTQVYPTYNVSIIQTWHPYDVPIIQT